MVFSRHFWVGGAAVIGGVIGCLFSPLQLRVLESVGDMFVNALFFIATPLIILSIIVGLLNIGSGPSRGKLEKRSVGYFLGQTLLASCLGVAGMAMVLVQIGFNAIASLERVGQAPVHTVHSVLGVLESIVPENIFWSLFENNGLELLLFSCMFGASLAFQHHLTYLKLFVESIHDVWVMISRGALFFLPLGVLSIIAVMVSRFGPGLFFYWALFIGTMLMLLVILSVCVLLLVWGTTGQSPMRLVRDAMPVLLTSFSLSHSMIVLPMTLNLVQTTLHIPRKLASYLIPLGTALNASGSALYVAASAVFISYLFGVEITLYHGIVVGITAMVSSIGGRAIQGSGLLALIIVLNTLGLPLEGIGIVIISDHFLGMFRSLVNSLTDVCATVIFAHFSDNPPALEKG